jgi:hypothetical protein
MAQIFRGDSGFRSGGERRQFRRFKEVLNNDHALANNFYIFQRSPLRMWEIDFCIISRERIFLVEHKSSPDYLSGVPEKVRGMPRRLLQQLQDYERLPEKTLPFVSAALIVDRPWKSEQLPDPLCHCVSSRDDGDTRLFFEEVIQRTPRRKAELTLEQLYRAITKNDPLVHEGKGINDRTFTVFDKVSECATKSEKAEVIPENEIEDLIVEQIDACCPLYHYASEVLSQIDENRQARGLASLFLHRQRVDYFRKFRPVYFVAITESEAEDYASHFQLSFHIGRGDKFNLSQAFPSSGLRDSKLRHLAVKLSIFKDMDVNELSAFIKRLQKAEDRERFRQLLLKLNEYSRGETEQFFLVRSYTHYKTPTIEAINETIADQIIMSLIDYNKPENRIRGVEFQKYFLWDERSVRDDFRRKISAIRNLRSGLEALLPLYDFMLGRDR